MEKNLPTVLTEKPHRGIDIISQGADFPTSAAAGQLHYTSSDVYVYDSGHWISTMSPSTTSITTGVSTTYTPSTTTTTVTKTPAIAVWANPLLPNDNDMLYIRRKDGKLYYLKANDFGGSSSWVEIEGSSTLAVGKAAGKVAPEAEVSVTIIEDELPDFEYGWYQDPEAHLFQYNSEGWVGVTDAISKRLNKMTEEGKMEYLG